MLLPKLLNGLDADRERAGDKYEELRRILIRFFEWRGAPFPEEQADETFNRVARRLDEGVKIKNIGGYCYEVARLVVPGITQGSRQQAHGARARPCEGGCGRHG
ncbi:MAG: hypothetical protein WKF84_24510 [Pyrinomonadaceae bacterium]